jgi:polyribonucleotide nucleotidyltransferase
MTTIKDIEKKYEIDLDGLKIEIQTGWMAKQASGSAVIKCRDTLILATVAYSKDTREGQDFFPLTVEYREKYYAAGRFPGGFLKREGRPRDKEILNSRLIDRPLRPLFPKGFYNEVQVITQVFSLDPEVPADILSITAASAALCLSEIPFNGPVGSVRMGKIDGQLVLNPSYAALEKSSLDLIIAGTENAVLMIEGVSKFVTEDEMVEAVGVAHNHIKKICQVQKQMMREINASKFSFEAKEIPSDVKNWVKEKALNSLADACFIADKLARNGALEDVKTMVLNDIPEEEKEKRNQVSQELHDLEKEIVRKAIIEEGKRVDARGLKDVRNIDIRLGLLPRAHGSALFTRGQTQSLGVVTLGTVSDVQKTDDLEGEASKSFMLHYNFPPFSVGEVKNLSTGRREIGHGNLAERSLENIVPDNKDFPYTIRVVSDILESNGSSSMASVCSGCLAMAQAGVPIKGTVAGVAMGLIFENEDKYAILTDISGTEDHLGDMDFKVAGTQDGITAFQMDIKIEGITLPIMKNALAQAKEARLFILEKMTHAIPKPANDLSEYAPRITTVQIDQEKIGELIGPGGRKIRAIIEESKAEINVDDAGVVTVAANNQAHSLRAIELIRAATEEVRVGKIYEGKVKKVMEYGAFIEIGPGKEGLCHISKLDKQRVREVRDVVKEGDIVKVKVLGVDRSGKIDLSRRDAMD